MSEQEVVRKPASLNKALKHGFGAAWDSLGYVVGVSFATFFAGAIVFTLMGLIAARCKPAGPVVLSLALPGMLVAWLCVVGVFYYARKALYHEHPSPMDTWEGVKKLAGPAIALFTADLLISVILVGDVVFFALAFKTRGGALFAGLAMVSTYIALMWFLMSLYHLPLLVAQLTMESGPKVKAILYKSYLLTADNPGFTLGLFVVIIAFAVLCVFSVLGTTLLLPGASAFVLTSSLRELFIKYGVAEEEPEVVEEKPWRLRDD